MSPARSSLSPRGELNFSQKLTNAANAGAAACVIYNNVPGAAVSMDLSQSYANIPCVGITKADADAIRAASTAVKDGDGNALYYTGNMTIGHKKWRQRQCLRGLRLHHELLQLLGRPPATCP